MQRCQPGPPGFRLCAFAFLTLLVAAPVAAQAGRVSMCPINRKVPDGLTISSVKVTGRRGVGPVEERLRTLLVGKPYTSASHDTAVDEVDKALTNETNKSFDRQVGTGAAVLYFTKCIAYDETTKQADVTVRAFYLRVDFRNLANNLLNLPRSLEPSFYDKMPAFLRALNPLADIRYDRRTGPTTSLELSTDLLKLKPLVAGEKISNTDTRLDLKFVGEKSLSEPFYQTKTDLKLAKERPGKLVEQWEFGGTFRADDQPLNVLRQINNGLRLGGQIKLRPRRGLLNTVFLAGAYRRGAERVLDESGRQTISERENAGSFRGLVDGRVWDGLARAGVWFESAEATRSSANYRRLAGLVGFQKEFGGGTQTLGVEAVVGGGTAWGRVPLYSRYFGGNNAGSFLYDSPDAPTMTAFPVGPLLRSYGKTQQAARSAGGGVIGGKSYWHANLNVAVPIPGWSRPLIPNEVMDDGTTLAQKLESVSVNTARNTIADNLLDGIIEELMNDDPTLSEDEATNRALPRALAEADKLVEKEIGPIVRYISRRANLFAVKPLIMLDAAQLGGLDNQPRRVRFAAGGGVQLVVVVARAEFGYMRSLPSFANEPKGNFVFRLSFQNFF